MTKCSKNNGRIVDHDFTLHCAIKPDLVAFNRSSGYGQDYGRRYVFKDHPSTSLRTSLGSTSVIVNGGGTKLWEERYRTFGELRYTWNHATDGAMPVQTAMRYTGQRFDEAIGLYYYNA